MYTKETDRESFSNETRSKTNKSDYGSKQCKTSGSGDYGSQPGYILPHKPWLLGLIRQKVAVPAPGNPLAIKGNIRFQAKLEPSSGD